MNNRVVVTGLGVVAPNGIGVSQFKDAIREGKSGIQYFPELKELKFKCQIAGVPNLTDELIASYFTPLELRKLNSSGILFGVIAGMDAWADAGLQISPDEEPDWHSGVIMGIGGSSEKIKEGIK